MPSPIPRPASTAPQPLSRLAELAGAELELIGPAPDSPDRRISAGRHAAGETDRIAVDAASIEVTGVTLRSADVLPGDLFAAIAGGHSHGARAIGAAVAAGAVAVLTDSEGLEIAQVLELPVSVAVLLVEQPREALGVLAAEIYGRPSEHLLIIGVTGTSGKTTTSYLIEAGLAGCGLHTGVIGTVETRIGSEVLPSAFTTPEAPDLQALLQLMRERGVQAVAMEVSSHALAMQRVAATSFAVGAFTNLSQDHLDFHHNLDAYFEAKALLFDGRAAAGVVDIGTEYGRRLAERYPELTTVSAFGEAPADWSVPSIDVGAAGITNLVVRSPRGDIPVALRIPGSFNVSNALLALACIDAAGLDAKLAAPTFASVVVPGRMQSVDCGQSFLAVVDYAHKPAALAAVLAAIRPDTRGKIIVVIGAGGDRDRGKRPLMGAAAAAGADLVIVTDDNPRSEDAGAIRAQILAGINRGDRARVHEAGDRRAAIRQAVRAAGPLDAVIIAGKGHEQGQYVGAEIIPFSDVDELTSALQDLQSAHRSGG